MKKLARSEKTVDCPWCYAKKGYACRGERGIVNDPHRQREAVYVAGLEAGTIVVKGPQPCRALNRRGYACQAESAQGSHYCGQHQPADEGARIKGPPLPA